MKSPNTDPWFFTCESLINKHYIEMVSILCHIHIQVIIFILFYFFLNIFIRV